MREVRLQDARASENVRGVTVREVRLQALERGREGAQQAHVSFRLL